MNNVYVSGQARYDLALPDEEPEHEVPEDFLDFILFDELRLDKLPISLIDSVKSSLLRNEEFAEYVREKFQENIDNDVDY